MAAGMFDAINEVYLRVAFQCGANFISLVPFS